MEIVNLSILSKKNLSIFLKLYRFLWNLIDFSPKIIDFLTAGDTFRAGAVEQLRTHARYLNDLHKNSVLLHEQGYGKDPAGLAAAAIKKAAEQDFDVVLVDTAGRMQDNEPLMRELAKVIQIFFLKCRILR